MGSYHHLQNGFQPQVVPPIQGKIFLHEDDEKRVGFDVVISPFPHMRLSENKLPFSLCCLVNVNHLVTIFPFF